MTIRTDLIGAAIAAVLSCTSVHAQVLGGGLGGNIGGTLNGGLNQMDMITQGSANGSIGGSLDTGSLGRSTRDITDRTGTRVRDTAGRVRNHTESTVENARDTGKNTAASAVGTATNAVDPRKVAAATNVAGSVAGDVSAEGANVAGAAEGAASNNAIATPEIGSAPAPTRSLDLGSSLDASADGNSSVQRGEGRLPLIATGEASANGSGSASAMRDVGTAQPSQFSSAPQPTSTSGSQRPSNGPAER